MSLTPGTSVGQYQIQSLLGVGGMGEVYRARDTKLQRDVALKILPDSFARDGERLARFAREARVLASLNHPHIAQIYGLEESGAIRGLVLELVDGETLAERLRHGPLALHEAVAVARQIADGLDAAHDKGVVHRDLKPANVKMTPDGTVKLLDFGLAKAIEADEAIALPHSPTITGIAATNAGVILGTAPYMSPEQAQGRVVDRRTDLWAFGAVLYEMLTGRAAFGGDSVAEVFSNLLMKTPDWSALPPAVPSGIRTLLERCLAKDRKARLDSAAAVRFALDDALTVPAGPTRAATGQRLWPWLAASLAAGGAIATAATWLVLHNDGGNPASITRFTIVPPATQPLGVSVVRRSVAISPDGRYLAYLSGSDPQFGVPMLRRLDELEARPAADVRAAEVFFSPDNQWLGFFDESGDLKKVAVAGGPVTTVALGLGITGGGSWGEDDIIAYTSLDPATGVMGVPAAGGDPRVLSRPDKEELDHSFTASLPRGRGILTNVMIKGAAEPDIAVIDPTTGTHKRLMPGNCPQYVEGSVEGAPGFLVFGLGGRLRAVRFDVTRLETVGEPVTLVEHVQTTRNSRSHFAVSRTGTLVYIPAGSEQAALRPRSLVWVDRKGTTTPIPVPPRPYGNASVSPDGRLAAIEVLDQESDIWLLDFARTALTRLTFGPAIEQAPVWAADSRQLIYMSNRDNRVFNLYRQSIDGSGAVDRLTVSGYQQFPGSLTSDGSRLVGHEYRTAQSEGVMWQLSSSPVQDAASLIKSTGTIDGGRLSPNGRYIAYQSDETGRREVYVRPFPDVESGRWQVSAAGGTDSRWTASGRELFYLDPSNALMTIPVDTDAGTFKAATPLKLFDTAFVGGEPISYSSHPDGQRFLMSTQAPPDPKAPRAGIVVVLNWLEELKQRVAGQ